MRLASIFDQGHLASLEFRYQVRVQRIISKDMRKEDRFRSWRDFIEHLKRVHPEGPWIDIDEDGLEAALNYRRNVGHPGERGNNHFAQTLNFSKCCDR